MRQPVPFGKYLLLDRISVGGMAEVFKAKSYGVEGFEKIIAIKRILPTMGEDRDFIKMFIDEAKIAGQLAHANICQIFELGRIDGSHFIAMEYIWGKDLLQIQNRLRKVKQQMPVPMACFAIAKVLEGLDYAHRKRDPLGRPLEIVHRDCSPQNVLVSYEGEVKVIDFGIAKATSRNSRTMAGVLKGKFGYMSPEQVRGLPLDRRSDIFALGTMLFECLTGERLFQGETDFSTLEKVRNVDIQNPRAINPNIPESVERVILKALAKDVDDRYQWCSEMLADLQQYLMGQDVVFTAKSLSGWLKDVFTGEIDKERALLEQYKRVGRDGLIAGMPAAEAKVDVVESLGEAGVPEGDATMLGSPNFDDLEQAMAANAAPEMDSKPVKAPAQQARGKKKGRDDDDGDFGEEAPTEIFGELDNPPKAAATMPPPMAAAPAASSTRAPTTAASPQSRPPKPPPGGVPGRSTQGQPAMAAPPPMAAHGPGVMSGGALPAPMASPMGAGAGKAIPNIANVPLVAPGPLGGSVPAGPATATRPAAMPLPLDVPAIGPQARTMGPAMPVDAIGPSARTMGPPMPGPDYAAAAASPQSGYPVYGSSQTSPPYGQNYYGEQQPTPASTQQTMMAGGTPIAAGTPSQPINAPGLAGGSPQKTMMGGMAAPSGHNNYGQQYRMTGQQAAASPYPSAAGYSGNYNAQQPYASGQMQGYGNQGYQQSAGAVEAAGIPADGKKKSSIGRDVAIGIAIAALVLGGFLAVKFLILDSGSSGSGSSSGSGATSSIATIRLSLPTGISAELYVDDKKVATVSNGLEIPVTAGQRKVKLLGPGGAKCEESLNLAAGKTTPLECAMKVAPETPGASGGSASGSNAGASTGTGGTTTTAGVAGSTTTGGGTVAAVSGTANVKAPETKAPETKAPETKAPETKAPETKAPETKAPETKVATTKAPETKVPETKAPETKTKAPDTKTIAKAPETKVPETKVPETKVPETKTKVPETKTKTPPEPKTKAPETKVKASETKAPAETASDKGYLQVQSTPSAKIFVDGVDTGLSSPIGGKQLSLAPGKHKVTFAIGGDKFTFAVMIKAGQTEVLKKDLQ